MRGLFALVVAVLGLGIPAAGWAQVTSAKPDRVSVTVYRAPYRSAEQTINPQWLEGYALITEVRTVTIPAGRAVIRFEGVAGGILPESAIVTGLPDGVREKNLDADLLSPRSLYAHGYGRPVTLRRTIGGKSVEEPAIIRSGPDGAAILQTKDGFEAADCRSDSDELVYHGVPEGLSAKPTLSVETQSARAGQVTLTLSYLAWGFDWQANYVATMRPDGKTADLFAWVTLANGDVTSFVDAETMVVAGRLHREDARGYAGRTAEPALEFHCLASPLPAGPAAQPMDFEEGRDKDVDIVVTGSMLRAALPPPPAPMMAAAKVAQEELGDLKLYRVPDRTTVAALGQKQVALLDKKAVPVDVVYRTHVYNNYATPVRVTLRARNRKERGLGVPLPAGPVAVFEPLGERRLLVGEGSIGDKAQGEEVEVEIADATQVVATVKDRTRGRGWSDHVLTVTNASPFAVRYEAEFETGAQWRVVGSSGELGRKNGHDLWAIEIPANGTVSYSYRLNLLNAD